MNIITQEAKKRQGAVKCALRKGKSYAARMYGVSLSSIKRWVKRYDGTWQSLRERSHRPHRCPTQHTTYEEELIMNAFSQKFLRYGWDGVYTELKKRGYSRSFSGMVHAAKRMGLGAYGSKKKPPRKADRRFPEQLHPGDKVQIDVKEVPYNCLCGKAREDMRHMYQWTAIDECTRIRFVYGYEEHTPENTVDFFKRLQKAFPFEIKVVQTDNGTEFTYKYISDDKRSPLDELLASLGIEHKLIPPRTPWHNGKVERSHRNDQRYFYDWEKFSSIEILNKKLAKHLEWSNNKPMRTLGNLSPNELLARHLEGAANCPITPPTAP